jgi:hypothetical protein
MTITVTPSNPTKVEAVSDTTTTINPNTFEYEFADSIVGTIDTGVTVDGVGLEFISTLPNSNTTTTTISVTNDGTVTAQSDSNSALEIIPIATGDFGTFTYLGTGNVTNTGNAGALRVDNQGSASGTGNVDITISGTSTINGTSAGDGIIAGTVGTGTVKLTIQSGGLVEGSGAVELGGSNTVDNSGTITGVSVGIQSATSEIDLDNKLGGMITATGTNANAIIAGEFPVPGGAFSGSNEGTITSQGSAITSAGNITLTSNSGMISTTNTTVSFGNAVSTVGDVKVSANTGTISGGFTAIQAGGNADVTNSKTITGGTGAGGGFGITASGSATLDNDNQNATVSGNAGAVNAGTDATVTNSGTLSSSAGDTILAGSGTAKVTNNATGTITSTGANVFAIAGNTVNLNNSGMVQATGGGGGIAVFSANLAPINVTNSGTIQIIGAAGTSIAIEGTATTGTNMISNSGTISSNGASAPSSAAAAIVVSTGTTITNSPNNGSPALIQDTGAGSVGILANAGSGAVSITNDGTISGDGNAINTNTSGLTTIGNTGTISNTTGGGGTPGDIRVNVASITNTGTGKITGADVGILFRNSQTTGSTIFNAGTISGATAAIQFSSASSGNTLTLGPGFTITGNVTQGAGNILQLGGSSGAGSFNVSNIGTQYQNFTTFNKIDTSSWTLTGSGAQAWTVEQGTLQVDGTIGNTTVQSGGILDGTGTTGAVTVDGGGTLAPGDDPGIMTTGNLDLQASSTLSIEIEGTTPGVGGFSQVAVNGSVTLAGTLSTTFLNGFTPQSGDSFEIINNDGNDLVSGTFAGLAQNATFTLGSATYRINYAGGDGNDVVLTVLGSFTATLSSNSPVQGTQISVATANDNGTDVLGTATYQWMVNTGAGFINATGTGATTATYTPSEGDEGGRLEVVVTDPANSATTTVTAANAVADSADLTATLSTNSPMQGSPVSLTSVTDGGTDVHATATYQWKVNTGSGFVNATGAGNATATYTPIETDEGGTLEVVITLAGDPGNAGNPEIATVVASNAVADSVDLTATISSNNPVQGSQISVATANDGSTDVLGTASYQWMVNTGVGFVNATGAGATTATYTPAEADEGGTLEVVVSVTDAGNPGNAETTTVVATNTVAEIADLSATLSTNSPVQASQISVATATDGGTNVLGTATYQWKVNTGGSFINATGTGATTATYTPTETDEGKQLEVIVSVADPAALGGIETTTLVAANTIADSADLTATFSTNNPVQGLPISLTSVTDGGIDAMAGAIIQWKVNTGTGFANATGGGAGTATYTPVEADEGGTLEVVISITGDLGNVGTIETTTVTVANAVADSVDLQGVLSLTTPIQGAPISLTSVTDDGNDVHASATYQWKVNTGAGFVDATGTGATTATYTPVEADEGGTLEVVISLAGDAGSTETTTVVAGNTVAESALSDLTATLSSNSPVQASQISVATATDGGTNVLGTASYQWKVNTGAGFINATGTGATTATYTPTEADEGAKLEVVVSVADPGSPFSTEATTVVATNAIADSADLTATFSTNSPMQGSPISLTAVTDGGIDAMAGAIFQWKVNAGSGFANATGTGTTTATYTPTEGDEGGQLEVVISITGDNGNIGTVETATVTVANAVADSADLTATLSSATPTEGTPISVTSASDSGTNVLGTATYQWKVNTGAGFVNATGTGATTATYTPVEADEGGTLEVVVTLAEPGGSESTTVTAGTVHENAAENAAIALAGLTSGNAVEGQQITATVTDADAPASGINFTWKVNGTTVFTGTDAAGKTYTPTEANEGLPITVSVSFTDTHGNAESGTASAGTVQERPTENASFTVSGLVNGQAEANHPLTATVTEPDAPASGITYTWKLNGVTKLTGVDAAAKTFTPQPGDAGTLSLSVSFTDTHGFADTGSAPVGVVASAVPFDLNGDSISDLVFQNNGQPGIWLWNGTAATVQVALPNPGASWHVITSRDVNGDGMADLIWQNTNGQPGVWLMNGTTPTAAVGFTNPGPSWQLAASGDTNGDGKSDLIWQNTDGTLGVWLMNGTTPFAEAGIGNPGSNWKVIGAADFDGDGRDDILLQDKNTGNLTIDLMNGTSISSTKTLTVNDPSWHAVSTGEFNGQAEIAWQNDNGQVGIWLMNGTTPVAKAGLQNPGPDLQLLSIDHFTPNGQADLLFQNTNGAVALWQLSGTNIVAQTNLLNSGTGWQSVNGHPFATG